MIEQLDLGERGRRFRFALEQRSAMLGRTTFPHVNDISDLLSEYLPEGVSFDDAEEILRAAGFHVYPRPSENAPGNDSDRYDVEGILRLRSGLLSKVECMITMRPKRFGDYGVVGKISAYIKSLYL